MGRNNETDVELQVFIDGTLVASVTIPELLVDSFYTLSYLWTPTIQDMYNVTAYAPPILGEEFTENNIAKKSVIVLLIAVRNVLVYTDDFFVPPLSRYVIVALNSLGINYTHYADDPWGFGAALVSQPWDLVIVDHYNYYAVGYYWTELDEYVRNGGRLVLSTFDIDGSHSEPTTLWDTLGVRWISDMLYSPEPVYRWMPSHPIFTFPNTVGDLTSYIYLGPVDYGDHIAATTSTPIAGFTISSTEDYAAIVVGNIYPTVLFSFTLDEFRYDEDGDGKLDAIELWQNAIVYLARGYEHDLAMSLDAPKFLEPGNSVLLNATVRNRGLSNETSMELHLLISGTVVNSVLIPEIMTGASYTLSYLWTPMIEGSYNVTAHAPPVLNETLVADNKATKFVAVMQPLIHPIEGQYANYTIYYVVPGSGEEIFGGLWNFTYLHYVSPYQINITIWMKDQYNYTQSGWMIVNIFTRMVEEDSGIYWTGMWYLGWIETNVTIGSVVKLLSSNGTIVDNEVVYVGQRAIDCWKLLLEYSDYQYAFQFNKFTGLWIGVNVSSSYSAAYLRLIATNVPIGSTYQHDLAVTLEVPQKVFLNEGASLSMNVYNVGSSDEENVTLQLMVNSTMVANVTVAKLSSNGFYNLSYLWVPPIEGDYLITAYAMPVQGESYTDNNIATKYVKAFSIKGSILFDQTHGTDVVNKCYSIWVSSLIERGYVVKYHVSGKITSDILNKYNVLVIPQARIHYYRDELSAIQSFVLNGGSLLVIEDDDTDIGSELTNFAYIMWSTRGQDGYTNDITMHAVTQGVNIAYFGDPEAYLYADFPSVGLIRDSGGHVMVAVSMAGAGKVLVIADEDSIVDWCIKVADNYILAKNAIDWLVVKGLHDVAVTGISLSRDRVYIGEMVEMNISVLNEGETPETFNLTVYYNISSSALVGERIIQFIMPNETRVLTFHWNTKAVMCGGNYTIIAVISTVPGEDDLSDNIYVGGWILVTIIGDIDANFRVDLGDLVLLAKAYGSRLGDSNWNEFADLAEPKGAVTLSDLVTLAVYYGQSA
jgi:hypothetical protein